MKLDKNLLQEFHSILGESQVLQDPAELVTYSYDNSRYNAMPDLVVLPKTTKQVSECIKLCFKHSIPVYPRGKGSATTGASIPINGGIVVSLEQMHEVLEFSDKDRYLVVQPGLTNEQ